MTGGRTRIAPTPNGYLHRGNLLHILVVDTLARRLDLDVHLRVDAFDSLRVRPDYVLDIFRALNVLQVAWNTGPKDPTQINTPWDNIDWHGELERASRNGLATYACRCSRKDRAAGLACTCQTDGVERISGQSALRLDADLSGLDRSLHGTLLWGRDDVPSTHLASIIADRDCVITHVIRGADLADSSQAQRAMAPFFDAESFVHAAFIHHPLLTTEHGEKLSKSAGAAGQPVDLSPQMVGELRELSSELARDC